MNVRERRKQLRVHISNLYALQSSTGVDQSESIAESGKLLEELSEKKKPVQEKASKPVNQEKDKSLYQIWKKRAIENGVKINTYDYRIGAGYSYEEAAQPKIKQKRRRGRKREPDAWRDYAEKNGISYQTYKRRLERGWSEQKAATESIVRKAIISINGEKYSIDKIGRFVNKYDKLKAKGLSDVKIAERMNISTHSVGKLASRSKAAIDRAERLKWKAIARENGLPESSYYSRVRRGYSYERAATQPKEKNPFGHTSKKNQIDKEQLS